MTLTEPEGFVSGYRSKVPPHLHEEIFWRVRNGEKCKRIAPEYKVSGRTLQRIVRQVAQELGMPANEWFELKRRRRREGWEYIQQVRAYRDQRALIEHQEEEREGAILQARLEAQDAFERAKERESRGDRQREMNERNKRLQGWG